MLTFNFIQCYIDFHEPPPPPRGAPDGAPRRLPVSADEPAAAPWIAQLNDEDLQFLRRFVLGSGSLKAIAEDYGVSYPTVRARLDRLIAKVEAASDPRITDPFARKLKLLVADGALPSPLARELLDAHRAALKGGK